QEAPPVDAIMLVVVRNVLAHRNPPFCPLFLDDNRAVHEGVDAAVGSLRPFCAVLRPTPAGEGTWDLDGAMASGARSAKAQHRPLEGCPPPCAVAVVRDPHIHIQGRVTEKPRESPRLWSWDEADRLEATG